MTSDSHPFIGLIMTLLFFVLCSFLALSTVEPVLSQNVKLDKPNQPPRIVNIVNFVRQCEPRIESITEDVLFETVVEQIKIMRKNNLRGTFLLQYDALIDERYQQLLKSLPKEQFEIGAWWEIMQPLVENSGYVWRGRYPWDWHADVGFSTGYSPEEREKLVDTYMVKFKDIFGYTPKSVGSWFIDAHTLNYLHERFEIVASCNCKDQIGTDGYTLWGGYWNQGYYPSKNNAFMPAQTATNQIPVPIFRMLGSDPIHQYDRGLGTNRQRVISLEPVYKEGGGNADWCNWYFDSFVNGAAMGYGYTQVGQENSFTWKRMAKGLEIQLPLVAQLRDKGKVQIQTLGETGTWFKQKYKVTPPTSVTVLKDYSPKDLKTVWFNSRFYRVNLLWEQGAMRFRDIHIFDEQVESDYLTQRGTSSQCLFDTLPIVDGFRWSSQKQVAGLRLTDQHGNDILGGLPTVTDDQSGLLKIHWPVETVDTSERNPAFVMSFSESSFEIAANDGIAPGWKLVLSTSENAKLPFQKVTDNTIHGNHRGTKYFVTATAGKFKKQSIASWQVTSQNQRIEIDLTKRNH